MPGRKIFNSISAYRTARDTGEKLQKITIKKENPAAGRTVNVIKINTEIQKQAIIGFGGAFTESSAYLLNKISPDKRQEVIKSYFSRKSGLGYSMGRLHINSCDFSIENYSCDDTEGDVGLEDFQINRDRTTLIPLIKDALKAREDPILIIATPWSPPAWMKDNGDMNNGGKLKAEYRKTWAEFFARFISEYEKEGIPIWGISTQNEPMAKQTWESCIFEAHEERDFIRDHLGPVLNSKGYSDKKILIWDHNRDLIFDRARTILSDRKAAEYVWGIAFHWYTGEEFDNVKKTFINYPDKPLIFTEGCIEHGVKLGQWDRGEFYAHHMINDFNAGTAAWLDWNLALDPIGGPNHVGNFCDAPIIINTDNNELFYQSSYYYIGHFSKFVPEGSRLVESVTERGEIESASFISPDRKLSLIVLNRSDKDHKAVIETGGNNFGIECLKHSITTYILE